MIEHQVQLAVMKEFLDCCERKEITVWLAGGWGIDFLCGEETRIHSDIDFMVNRDDYARILKVVSEYADDIMFSSVQKMKFTKNGIRFDLCFFVKIDKRYFIDLDVNNPFVYPMPEN